MACFTPSSASDIASKDTSRLQGTIAKALAVNSPFVNILKGGVFPAGVSDVVRSVVQEQSLPGDSLVTPTFADTVNICAPVNANEGVATTEYSYKLGTKRGFGPKVCVKGAYAAFRGSYLAAEDSLKKLMLEYVNVDIRSNLLNRSGVKFVAGNSGTVSFSQGLTGGESQIDTAFANIAAANIGQLSFKALHQLARYNKEVLLGEMFNGDHYKFIGGSDIIEAFRNEIGVKDVLISLTTGNVKFGENALRGYSWESSIAYRGIQFGVDQRPIRASAVTAGVPTLVEPFISVATTKGSARRVNPAWVSAPFEIGFLIGDNTFERLVPERFTGEGSFKYAPQLAMGELQWHYQVDNDCNAYGDFGFHKYEITRAYRPIRPANVIPVLYRRCPYDTGIVSCPTSGSLL
ncbi:MAG: hypothetical protein EBR82_21575 [Caulobacteraceae bacterium]|nr:hypothetical protein [Caulobacteraceae bacterium]